MNEYFVMECETKWEEEGGMESFSTKKRYLRRECFEPGNF